MRVSNWRILSSGYLAFVGTGNHQITRSDGDLQLSDKTPQMPTYHLKRANGSGITLVNIGVGPLTRKLPRIILPCCVPTLG